MLSSRRVDLVVGPFLAMFRNLHKSPLFLVTFVMNPSMHYWIVRDATCSGTISMLIVCFALSFLNSVPLSIDLSLLNLK